MHTEDDKITLSYKQRSNGGDWHDKIYPVWLEWTSCNYGGKRAWFLCPAKGCSQRIAILYGGTIFACRCCHKLVYPCQRETVLDRTTRRAEKIRSRLGWEVGILNPPGNKPKGMHWQTFWKLDRQHNVFLRTSLDVMAQQLGLRD